jgi:hypothetical protein
VVVLDEVHERHVSTDLLLGMMKHSVLPRAPSMRLVLMSATVNIKVRTRKRVVIVSPCAGSGTHIDPIKSHSGVAAALLRLLRRRAGAPGSRQAAPHRDGVRAAGARRSPRAHVGRGVASVASFLTAVFTDIYLCNVCSCQEILRHDGRG